MIIEIRIPCSIGDFIIRIDKEKVFYYRDSYEYAGEEIPHTAEEFFDMLEGEEIVSPMNAIVKW